MPTPDFVLALREHIGTAPLWLIGVTAVTTDDRGRVLMVRRADDGRWTPVTGIVDPGEHPTTAAVRESREEAGVEVVPGRLAQVGVTRAITYANGDVSQYLDLTYRCHHVSGSPHPADGENTEARWYDPDDLPEMSPFIARRIEAALADETEVRQVVSEQ